MSRCGPERPRAPSKSPALPHGRATERAEAQISSPRVSKGCIPNAASYGTLTGSCREAQEEGNAVSSSFSML